MSEELVLSSVAVTKEVKGGKGKIGRNKRRKTRKGTPISLYVRNQIDASTYFRLTNQSAHGTK